MKTLIVLLVSFLFISISCHDNSTGPDGGSNLIQNPTFEVNGLPSLKGWKVAESSTVTFSTDVPFGGGGHSIIISADVDMPWPANSIYASIPLSQGTHTYRLSFYGKKSGTGGGVIVYYNRPGSTNYRQFMSLSVAKSYWMHYTLSDTLTCKLNDTLFVSIHGGRIEKSGGTTYFNSCMLSWVN
jgi:hypothetical protein